MGQGPGGAQSWGTSLPEDLTLTDAKRLLKITTPLGPNKVTLRRLVVREAIARPFTLEAEIISSEMDLQPSALIGKSITCTIDGATMDAGAGTRHFNAVVRGFARIGAYGRGLAAYRLEAVPLLWHMSRTADCRIFQSKSVKDIVTTILGEAAVAPVRWGSSVPTATRVYCVQYNETDLDFAQRLLEEVGCGYYFEQAEGSHTLVVCGANADYPLVPGSPQVVRSDAAIFGALSNWRPVAALQPGKVVALDFDQVKPSALLTKEAATVLTTPGVASWEVFRWPGGQAVRPDQDTSKLGMEGFEANADLISAAGNDPRVFAGGRLKVLPGIDATSPETWLVTETVHEAFDETHLSGGGTASYRNGLTLMPADRPWRPMASRPRPAIPGLHSAIVTGPSGEEIHTDKYGRISVHFHWDRKGKKDDTSSCWVRVAQSFAGKWGGSWTLPRVGDEVLVGFMDGDPDRPVAIGSVYNADNMPIYALPANKTQSGFKTKSSKGGGAANFNEIRFEDKKGSEHFNVQAEKDMMILVKNDKTEHVKHDRTETIDHDHTETIKNNKTETVKVDRTETVEGKHTETVTGDYTVTVKTGNQENTVSTGNQTNTIKTGNMTTEVSMGNQTTTVKMGNITHKASLGAITVEAMQSITLKCGPSKIVIDPSGVTIEGPMIQVKGTAMVTVKAPLIMEEAQGPMILKGAIVLINSS